MRCVHCLAAGDTHDTWDGRHSQAPGKVRAILVKCGLLASSSPREGYTSDTGSMQPVLVPVPAQRFIAAGHRPNLIPTSAGLEIDLLKPALESSPRGSLSADGNSYSCP